jgi:hypothetical protein
LVFGVVLPASAFAYFAVPASAQGLITTDGVLIAVSGDPVPDANGNPIANLTFGNTIDDCTIDASGRACFRAQVVDSMTPVTGINDRGIFVGASRATLKLVARGGDQAPGMASGVLLRTSTGSSTSLASAVRVSPDGRLWWASKIYDGGVNITAANDDPCFGGFLGSQSPLFSDGMVAPGTGGALFAQAFSSPSQAFEGMNSNGVAYIRATLVTGTGVPPVTTTSGMNNQQGLWTGLPGSLTLIARKSDPVQGLGGEVAIDNANSISLHTAINSSGNVLFDLSLSLTQGAPAATAANDRVLMVHVAGVGNQVLVRESDSAPGTSGGTFNSISVTDNWGPSLPQNAWTNTNEVIFNTELRGGDTVAGVNDKAIYRGGIGGLTMVVRRGDVAPGTGGQTFLGFNTANTLHNANGQVVFQGFMNLVGPVTTSNDSGIWFGTPGNLQLVVREGDVMPGTGGSVSTSYNGANVYFNDAGQVLFHNTLSGGANPGASLWAWDQGSGLRAIILAGDQIEVTPGVFKTISVVGFTGNQISNTDGASLCFGHDGTLGMRLNFTDNSRAIATLKLEGEPVNYCTSGTTSNGCNAQISASANPNVAHSNACNISVSSVEGQKSGLIFYGLVRHNIAWCPVGGSSYLCVKTPTQRTPSQNSGGTVGACDGSYALDWNAFQLTNPGGLGTPFTGGSVVDLQCWFRDPPACKTTNLSDAIELTYAP